MSETGGRSRLTPRYLRGIAEATPRARAGAPCAARGTRRAARRPRARGSSRSRRRRRAGSWAPRPDSRRQPHRSRHGAHASSAKSSSACPRAAVPRRPAAPSRRSEPRGAIDEPRVLLEEHDGHVPGRPVAVLGDDQVGLARVGVLVVLGCPVDEDRRRPRPARCRRTREGRRASAARRAAARERGRAGRVPITGTFELPRQDLQAAAELAHLLDAVGPRVLGAHQLDVVDDHQPEPALARGEAARLGPQLEQAQVGGVVEPQRHLLELVAGPHHPGPVARGDVALAELVVRDPRPAGDEAVGELRLRHLEREEGDRLAVLGGDVLGDVADERRLAERGPGRDRRSGCPAGSRRASRRGRGSRTACR